MFGRLTGMYPRLSPSEIGKAVTPCGIPPYSIQEVKNARGWSFIFKASYLMCWRPSRWKQSSWGWKRLWWPSCYERGRGHRGECWGFHDLMVRTGGALGGRLGKEVQHRCAGSPSVLFQRRRWPPRASLARCSPLLSHYGPMIVNWGAMACHHRSSHWMVHSVHHWRIWTLSLHITRLAQKSHELEPSLVRKQMWISGGKYRKDNTNILIDWNNSSNLWRRAGFHSSHIRKIFLG